METLTKLFSNLTIENILSFILSIGITVLIIQLKLILRRIRLSEFKHIATVHALGKSLGNGFIEHYRSKLDDLIGEFNFKTGR